MKIVRQRTQFYVNNEESETTHTIILNKNYFLNLILGKANVNTVSGIANIMKR